MALNLITGGMFSGKTTKLMRRLRRAQVEGKKVLVINFAGDNRYTDEKGGIASHAGEVMMSEKWGTLTDKDVRGYDVIGIDELHCFPDFLVTEHWASLGIRVEAALINGNFERKPIDAFTHLAARASHICFLNAVCAICRGSASFSKRIINSVDPNLPENQRYIGGVESYSPRCYKCFYL